MKTGKLIGIVLVLVGFFLGGQIDIYLSQYIGPLMIQYVGHNYLGDTVFSYPLSSFLGLPVLTFVVRYTFVGIIGLGLPLGLHMLVVIGIVLLLLT